MCVCAVAVVVNDHHLGKSLSLSSEKEETKEGEERERGEERRGREEEMRR